jgi:hypothetical protein
MGAPEWVPQTKGSTGEHWTERALEEPDEEDEEEEDDKKDEGDREEGDEDDDPNGGYSE